MRSRLLAFVRLFAAVAFATLVLALPAVARAAGTVSATDLQPKEDDGKWKLKMTMNYGGVPPTAHIPMMFTFTPTVLYERTLTDKSPNTPVINRIPLQNQQAINESMDVGFSDASGKIFNITKFDFVIRRDHGFEAGEYTLVIKRSSDGTQMGQQLRIVLQGDNPVVDRRAIVFSGEKKEKKADKTDAAPASTEPQPGEPPPGGDPVPDEPPPVETPPATPPKQGGCGCRVADSDTSSRFGLVAGAGALAFALRRRRRR